MLLRLEWQLKCKSVYAIKIPVRIKIPIEIVPPGAQCSHSREQRRTFHHLLVRERISNETEELCMKVSYHARINLRHFVSQTKFIRSKAGSSIQTDIVNPIGIRCLAGKNIIHPEDLDTRSFKKRERRMSVATEWPYVQINKAWSSTTSKAAIFDSADEKSKPTRNLN